MVYDNWIIIELKVLMPLLQVLVPYMKHKLDQLFEHLRDKQAAGLSSSQVCISGNPGSRLWFIPHTYLESQFERLHVQPLMSNGNEFYYKLICYNS